MIETVIHTASTMYMYIFVAHIRLHWLLWRAKTYFYSIRGGGGPPAPQKKLRKDPPLSVSQVTGHVCFPNQLQQFPFCLIHQAFVVYLYTGIYSFGNILRWAVRPLRLYFWCDNLLTYESDTWFFLLHFTNFSLITLKTNTTKTRLMANLLPKDSDNYNFIR